MVALVIFDLDGTLASVNVSFAFGRFLYHSGQLSFLKMALLVAIYALHKCGICRVESVHTLAFRFIFSNKSVQELESSIQQFLLKASPWLFRPHLLKRLEEAKAEKSLLWLQSSSPECLVAPIAKLLGIPTVFASSYEIHSDGTSYSAVASVVTGHKKRAFLDQFLQKQPLSREGIIAYTDSALDLPLLEGVGTPVAVFPDRKLKKIARRRGWQIWEE